MYFWWIHLVKNQSHQLVIILILNNLDKLIQTPSGGWIVLRKYNYWHHWVLNGFEKLCRNFFSPWKLIINESVNTPQMQHIIQMAYKTKTSIFTSKTREDIKLLGFVGERTGWGSFAGHKSHRDLWENSCKDLKGGERKMWRYCNITQESDDKLGRGWMQAREAFKGRLFWVCPASNSLNFPRTVDAFLI